MIINVNQQDTELIKDIELGMNVYVWIRGTEKTSVLGLQTIFRLRT